MAMLLFKLYGVPQDEAEEVRTLLTDHKIDFYETSGGNWGVSVAALWLKDEDQYQQTRKLLDEYNEAHRQLMQDEYKQSLAEGKVKFYLTEFLRHPIRLCIYLLVAGGIIFLSTIPFINFGQ